MTDESNKRCTWAILLGILLTFAGGLGPVGHGFLHALILFLGGFMILAGCFSYQFTKKDDK